MQYCRHKRWKMQDGRLDAGHGTRVEGREVRHIEVDRVRREHGSVSASHGSRPLFCWCSVARGARGNAPCSEKSFHEMLGFARLHRRQALASLPMRMAFVSPRPRQIR